MQRTCTHSNPPTFHNKVIILFSFDRGANELSKVSKAMQVVTYGGWIPTQAFGSKALALDQYSISAHRMKAPRSKGMAILFSVLFPRPRITTGTWLNK